MSIDKFQVRDLSEDLVDDIFKALKPYSLFMVGINIHDNVENLNLVGSGTLIKYKNFHGILTANHVVQSENFKNVPKIGFSLLESPIRFEIEQYSLITHPVAEYQEIKGPDLAIIEIPKIKLYYFKEHKKFLNLEDISYEIINDKYGDNGVWIIAGCAVESAKSARGNRNFDEIISFTHTFWFGGNDKNWEKDGFDYIESKAVYDEENEPPDSFRGVSGGGLWQVPLSKSENGKIDIVDFILAGVAFYQTEVIENHRYVWCHGKKSIYEKVKKILDELT